MLSLATLAGAATLLSLGFWQLDRAQWREAQDAQIEARRQLGAVYITRFPDNAPDELDALDQRSVRLLGQYQERTFLLDNQVRDKRVGFAVLTPFDLAHHNQTVLVDRGWIPAEERRNRLPAFTRPDDSERQIEGTVHRAEPNPFADPEYLFEGTGWPQIVQDVAYERFAERLDENVMPLIVRLDPAQADGFRRDWPPPPMTVEKHLAYAAQWFAMALVFTLLMLGLIVRVRRRP